MAKPTHVQAYGDQFMVLMSDGSRMLAVPTPTGNMWIVSDKSSTPDPGEGGWHSPMGDDWPKNRWTSYTGEPSHDAGACDFGTGYGGEVPLRAPCDGTVTYAGWGDGGGGYQIVVKVPGEDRWIAMLHLNRVDVSVGDTVTGNQVIGLTGWTGNVQPPGPGGAHLHLEVRTQPNWGAWVRTPEYFASKGVIL